MFRAAVFIYQWDLNKYLMENPAPICDKCCPINTFRLIASVCFSHHHHDAMLLWNFPSLIFVITHQLALWKLDVVHSSEAALPQVAGRCQGQHRWLASCRRPLFTHHPRARLEYQPSASPLSWLYVSPDDHTAYSVCVCVACSPGQQVILCCCFPTYKPRQFSFVVTMQLLW